MLAVEVIGNLGADAVIREFSGQKFIAFSVAHTESYNNAQGQKQERTTWVSCLKYGESAVLNYLKKGTRVFVRGELSTKIYEAGGSPQVGVNCKVKELKLLGGTKTEGQQPEPQQQAQAAPTYQQDNSNPFPPNSGSDDLPF